MMSTLARQPVIALVAGLAALVCIAVASAAEPDAGAPDPRKNPVNKTLNKEPEKVAGAIREWSLSAVRLLSERLPVCFAYLIEDEEKPVSETFKKVLQISARTPGRRPKSLVALQIHRAGGTDPWPHLMDLKSWLATELTKVRFEAQQVNAADFATAARCERKATMFIIGDQIQFYEHQLPPATVFHEKISMDSILFLTLRD